MAQPPAPSPEKLSLNILHYTTTSQATHGLRHGDYLRYRRYCTRRLARLRASTHPRTGGTSGRYTARAVTPELLATAPRALPIPLVAAERDWAFARDAKRTQPAGAARAGRVVRAKLRRAVARADEFRALCEAVCDERTVLEAAAYASALRAEEALERSEWRVALRAYEVAHDIYAGMAGVGAGSSAGALFERRMEELGNAMRLCRYHIARGEGGEIEGAGQDSVLRGLRTDAGAAAPDALAEKIEAALVEARRRAAMSFGEITWCGITVPMRAERVREAVLMAQEESDAIVPHADDVDAYDALFIVYNDAMNIINEELVDFRASTSTRADDRIKELEYLLAYLTYNRLQHTVARNLLLVRAFKTKRAAKPEDFVRLYDNLLSNVTDMLALSGVEGDAGVSNTCAARRKLFLAHRCFHLAQCYHYVGLQNEAAALFDRVGEHAAALSGEYAEEAEVIVQESTGMKCRAKAEAFIKQQDLLSEIEDMSVSEDGDYVTKSLLVDNLDVYESFVRNTEMRCTIADMPPALEAVPCKPVLFDLAIDGIRFPEKRKKQEEKAAVSAAEQPASAFQASRFARWWSGKS